MMGHEARMTVSYPRAPGINSMSESRQIDEQLALAGEAVALLNASGKEASGAATSAEVARKDFVRSAKDTVEKTIILTDLLSKSWETFFSRPEPGVAERARALRGDFLHRLEHSLDLVRFVLAEATRAATLDRAILSPVEALSQRMTALESIKQEVLSQWGIHQEEANRVVGVSDLPLRLDNQGDIHIGASRVLLDTIVEHFKTGMPVEEIIRGYDTLVPADVYEAIAYYLRHKEDVEAYLQRRQGEADALWQHIEATQPSREDLKTQTKDRWLRRKLADAAAGE